MASRIEIYKHDSGEFKFRLRSKEGDIVATSPRYPTKALAEEGVAQMLKVVAKAKIVDQTSD